MSFWIIAYWVVTCFALAPAILLTLQTLKFGHYVRELLGRPDAIGVAQRVRLCVPCKGIDPGLEENLRPLFRQDHPDYELALIVESASDPAYQVLARLQSQHPQVRSQLIVAGRAEQGGQKVHNLLAATADLGDCQLLAFVDSDARPHSSWLTSLVDRLHYSNGGANTGYRWFVPERSTLPNLVLYSVNANIASLIGPGRHSKVWGGAWAIRRDVFDAIELRTAWQGTLSDDLVASQQLALHRKRLCFRPGCMTASPIDFSWAQLLEFISRQYTVARFYAPGLWLLGLVFCTMSQLVFWSSMLAAVVGFVLQASWFAAPAAVAWSMYLTYVVRAAVRQRAALHFLPGQRDALRSARRFDVWCGPLAALVNWIGLLLSLRSNRITWRGITYAMQTGGQAHVLARDASPDVSHSTITTHRLKRAG